MEIGCCVSLGDIIREDGSDKSLKDQPGKESSYLLRTLKYLKKAGFDFVEFPVSMIDSNIEKDRYYEIKNAVNEAGIKVKAFNCFIPGHLKIVGPNVDMEVLQSHVFTALTRAAGLGASVMVLGSGGARNVPEDWPADKAVEQIKELIDMAASIAKENRIKIAIEHLNSGETNFGNTLNFVTQLAKDIDNPSVGVLADLYHLEKEGERLSSVVDAADLLIHTHVADSDRRYPGSGDSDLKGFIYALKEIGYDGGISVECRWDDFITESRQAALALSEQISSL